MLAESTSQLRNDKARSNNLESENTSAVKPHFMPMPSRC